MLVAGGSTDVTTYFAMRLTADGKAATGLTITGFDLQYVRSGVAPVAKVDATALVATDSTHADNKAFEIDATDQPGLYRVDWPDAAFAAGVREVILSVKVATAFTEHLRVEIDGEVNVVEWAGTDVVAGAIPAAAADAGGGLPISDAGGLDLDAKLAATNEVTAVRMAALTDWINGNRLDVLLDAIPTTAMRGTDSAATAASLATLTDALVLTSATIETVTSQTAFVIPATDDATDDGAYHGATAVFIDGTDPNQKSIRLVTDYTASSRTIEVQTAPDFTITTSDTITILACAYTEGIWDQILTGTTHNITTSAGRRLRQLEQAFVQASGTIATVTNGHTLTLDAGAVATADFYEHARLQIIEGTGAGQARIIVGYTSGRVATLDSDFTTNPDTSSLYEIVAADVHTSVSSTDLAEGFVATFTNTTTITLDNAAVATTDYYKDRRIIFTHGTGAGQSREITTYTSGRVCTLAPALITDLDTTTVWHIVDAVDVTDLVDDILTTQMTESYAANGTAPTLAQCQFAIHQMLMQFGISGTSLTVRKLDDTATAFIVTLDDATNPTDAKRV